MYGPLAFNALHFCEYGCCRHWQQVAQPVLKQGIGCMLDDTAGASCVIVPLSLVLRYHHVWKYIRIIATHLWPPPPYDLAYTNKLCVVFAL